MMPELESLLLEKWSEFALPGARPRRLQFLQTCPPGEGRSYVLLFAFRPGARTPAAVAKVKRARDECGALRAEAEVLRRLREELPTTLGGTLPRVLGVYERGAPRALLLEAPRGTPLGRRAAWHRPAGESRRLRHELRVGLGWLRDFQQATRGEPIRLGEELLEKWVGAPLRACRERVGVAAASALGEAAAGALAETTLFLCARHGALRPEHLLRDRSRLTVMNWEQAGENALPLLDAVQFVTATAAHVPTRAEGARALAAFQHTWLEPTPVREVIVEAVRRYASAVGIDAGTVAWALPAFLADQALRGEPCASAKHHWYDCLRLLAEDPSVLAHLANTLHGQG